MIHDLQLLLLDEPTAGVDPKARRDFWAEFHRLSADGLTVLIHDASIHVTGRDEAKLDAAIGAPRDARHTFTRVDAGFEDVFISLMDEARDNFS